MASGCGGVYLEMFLLVAMVQPVAVELVFGLALFCVNRRHRRIGDISLLMGVIDA